MKLFETEWTTIWTIGDCEIQLDRWHSCYDVIKDNTHRYCVKTLDEAVDKVLELQGWGKDFLKNSLRFSLVATMYDLSAIRNDKKLLDTNPKLV